MCVCVLMAATRKKCSPLTASYRSCLLRQILKPMNSNKPTFLSFTMAQQHGQCHIEFFRKHELTDLSDKVPFVKAKRRKALDVSLQPLRSYLLVHIPLSNGLPTRQKLTQRIENFAGICRPMAASYVLLSIMSWRRFGRAT